MEPPSSRSAYCQKFLPAQIPDPHVSLPYQVTELGDLSLSLQSEDAIKYKT